jgi:hypothetical protein
VLLVRRRLRGDAPRRPDATAPTAGDAEDDPDDVEAAVADGLAGLAEGSPRNAVVACWVRLEDVAEAQGLPRRPADTPAEFVGRALDAYPVDPEALARLADLYREARFSTHPLTEAHRAEARSCLERIAFGLRPAGVAP